LLAPFDAQFQSGLRAKTVAASSANRDDRLALRSLYERGQDDVISKAFEQFSACFGLDSPGMTYAYLSEINLAMRRKPFNRERVSEQSCGRLSQ